MSNSLKSNHGRIGISAKCEENGSQVLTWLSHAVASISLSYQRREEEMDGRLFKIRITSFATVFKSTCCLLASSLRHVLLLCLDTLLKSNPKLSFKNFKLIYSSPHAGEGVGKIFWTLSFSPVCNFSLFIAMYLTYLSPCVNLRCTLRWSDRFMCYDMIATITSHNYHFFFAVGVMTFIFQSLGLSFIISLHPRKVFYNVFWNYSGSRTRWSHLIMSDLQTVGWINFHLVLNLKDLGPCCSSPLYS